MTAEQIHQTLESLRGAGMLPGTGRIAKLLSLLGHPERRLRVIQVAGTNGKGSTSRMLQSLFTAAGYRTGLYTSPTVTTLYDTITIDGSPIPEAVFGGLLTEITACLPQLQPLGGLSEFECVTALCLLWFAREHTDLCVIECGLGGRDDATNVFPALLAAVFTPIALDHTALLGKTVEQIARNKAGILHPSCAVVSAPGQDIDALSVLFEEAAQRGLTVRTAAPAPPDSITEEAGMLTFLRGKETYALPLCGRFQIGNALTALETADALEACGFTVDEAARHQGLSAVQLPCRQELLPKDPPVLLDGAHNPHGIAALRDTLCSLWPDRPVVLVIGMLRDKDTAACAKLLAPLCAHVRCCTPESPRALEAEALCAQFLTAGNIPAGSEGSGDPAGSKTAGRESGGEGTAGETGLDVRACASPEEALREGWALSRKHGLPLVIGGSFTVAGPLRLPAQKLCGT